MASIKKNNEQEKALNIINAGIAEVSKYNLISQNEIAEVVVTISLNDEKKSKIKVDLTDYNKDISTIISKARKCTIDNVRKLSNKYDIQFDEKEEEILK